MVYSEYKSAICEFLVVQYGAVCYPHAYSIGSVCAAACLKNDCCLMRGSSDGWWNIEKAKPPKRRSLFSYSIKNLDIVGSTLAVSTNSIRLTEGNVNQSISLVLNINHPHTAEVNGRVVMRPSGCG